jgi:hypothetical protein
VARAAREVPESQLHRQRGQLRTDVRRCSAAAAITTITTKAAGAAASS